MKSEKVELQRTQDADRFGISGLGEASELIFSAFVVCFAEEVSAESAISCSSCECSCLGNREERSSSGRLNTSGR